MSAGTRSPKTLTEEGWLYPVRFLMACVYIMIFVVLGIVTGQPRNLLPAIGLSFVLLLFNQLFRWWSSYFRKRGKLESFLFWTVWFDVALACGFIQLVGRTNVVVSVVVYSVIILTTRAAFSRDRGIQISLVSLFAYAFVILSNRLGWWGNASQQVSLLTDIQLFSIHLIFLLSVAFVALPRAPFAALKIQGIKERHLKESSLEKKLADKTKLLAESYVLEEKSLDESNFFLFLKTALTSFLKVLNAHIGSILLYNEESGKLELKVISDLSGGRPMPPYSLQIGEELSGWVARTKKPLILLDTEKDPPTQAINYERYLKGTVVSLPLSVGERILGVINVAKRSGFLHKDSPLSESDLENIKLLEIEMTRGILNYNLKVELEGIAFSMVKALVRTLEAKDQYTKHHSENVAWYSVLIAKEMGLSQVEIRDILFACQLHDLGKIGISDEILSKAGPLSDEEWEVMKKHPALGEDMLKPIKSLRNVAMIIREEHERYDGRGYPNGLKGDEISLMAQIVAVADAFDVITSKRSYKEAQSVEYALSEISRCSGTQFNPRVVRGLLDAINHHPLLVREFMQNRHIEGYVEGKLKELLQ